MVATSIIALIVIIAFFAYLGWIFFFSILELLINGVLIYVLFLRAYVEIIRERKHYFYLGGAAFAMIVYYFLRNFLSGVYVWDITTYLLLAFIFAQAGQLIHYLQKKYKKTK